MRRLRCAVSVSFARAALRCATTRAQLSAQASLRCYAQASLICVTPKLPSSASSTTPTSGGLGFLGPLGDASSTSATMPNMAVEARYMILRVGGWVGGWSQGERET